MNEPLPSLYRQLVGHFIARAAELLAEGQALVPLCFVGSTTTQRLQIVNIGTQSVAAKDKAATLVARTARTLQADFVFTITEAYASPADKAQEAVDFMAKGGRLSRFPGRVDIVSFSLETPEGCWAAMAPVAPHEAGVPRDMDVAVQFVKVDSMAGRFFGLLPPTMSRH